LLSCSFCALFNVNELLSNSLTTTGCTVVRGTTVVDVVVEVVVVGGTVVDVVVEVVVVGATVVVVGATVVVVGTVVVVDVVVVVGGTVVVVVGTVVVVDVVVVVGGTVVVVVVDVVVVVVVVVGGTVVVVVVDVDVVVVGRTVVVVVVDVDVVVVGGTVVVVDVVDVDVVVVGGTVVVVVVVVGATVVVVVVVVVVDVVVVPVLMSAPALSATKLSPICAALVPARDVFPEPRRPLPPLPQHFTVELSSMAHVCASPADTASTVRPVPRFTAASAFPISLGTSPMSACDPIPNFPSAPLPKHFTAAVFSNAHVCAPPAVIAIALTPVPKLIGNNASPISFTSIPRSFVSPVPNRPFPPEPQHFTVALSSSAHVCKSPAEMATAVRPVPKSIVGDAAMVGPMPSPMLSKFP